MRELFFDLSDRAFGALADGEALLVNFTGEESDFVRFNRGRVRQPMTIRQAHLTLTLIRGRQRIEVTLALTGRPELDAPRVLDELARLRTELPTLPEDPHLLFCTEPTRSDRREAAALPDPAAAIDDVLAAAGDADLVGILASGPMLRGYASSFGARHWHEVDAFLLDWSLVHSTDKAVKCAWAGAQWDRAELARRMQEGRTQLGHLALPARTLSPGEYRTFLAPAAVDELVWMLNWGGVSEKAQRTKQSCIQKLADGQARLSARLQLTEDNAAGLAPAFDAMGFARPSQVALVRDGAHAGAMVSPRTAAEYGIAANGADEDEGMSAASLAPGSLPEADALAALDTGIYVGNLHYLNFSDRANGRVTGMTRFATFWVEHGRIAGPLNVMRWDDTLYRMLGDRLEALTDTPHWILNSSTYQHRAMQTSRVPGALLSSMQFTL
jgi:predicted Zn-dependent protease